MEQRRQRAVKSIASNRSSGRPFHYDCDKVPQIERTNGSPEEDDDVVIINDDIADEVKEDLKKALQPASSVSTTSAVARSRSSVTSASAATETPKLVIDSVRNISRSEFQRLQSNVRRQLSGPQQATTSPAQQPVEDEESSDSDIEIIEERILSSTAENKATNIETESVKKPLAFKAISAPALGSSGTNLTAGLRVISQRFGPRSVVSISQVPSASLIPQPRALGSVQPASVLTQQRSSRPVLPATVLHSPFLANRSSIPLQRLPNQLQRLQKPIQWAPTPLRQAVTQTPTPNQPANGAPPFTRSSFQARTGFNLPSSSIRPILPQANSSSITRQTVEPKLRAIRPDAALAPAASSTAIAFARAAILRSAPPQIPDETPLPIFGQNYMSRASGAKPVTRNQSSSLNQRADLRRRRVISSGSSTSSSSFTASTSSSESEAVIAKRRRRRDSGSIATANRERKTANSTTSKTRVKFPEGYYGRLRAIAQRSPKSDNDGFDGFFQCNLCKDICVSNLAFVNHMYSHILHPAIEDEALESRTRCNSCWRQFDDLFTLTNHCEEVHGNRPIASVCYICELAFGDDAELHNHMRQEHAWGYDMPYSCKACRFRSSLFEDVWNHFSLEHKNTVFLMCPLCLLTVEAGIIVNKYSSKLTTANTDSFARHISKHMEVKEKFPCGHCKLQFVSQRDLVNHQRSYHRQLRPNEIAASKTSSGILALKWDGPRPLTEIESQGKRLVTRRLQHETTTPARFTVADADCIECMRPMNLQHHYAKHLKKCEHCQFSTYCVIAFLSHKATAHRDPPLPFEYSRVPPRRAVILEKGRRCACGYENVFGNRLAEHIASCPTANGQISLKDAGDRSPRSRKRREPLMNAPMMAALGIRARTPDDPCDQQMDGSTATSSCEVSQLDVIPKNAKEPAEGASPKRTLAQEQRETSSPVGSPSRHECSASDGSPHRPRLLSPQMLKKRFSNQASVVEDEMPSPQTRAKKTRRKSPSPARPSKLGARLARYEEWQKRSDLMEAALIAACAEVEKMVDLTAIAMKKDLYDLSLNAEIPAAEEAAEAPGPSTGKHGPGPGASTRKPKKRKRVS